MHQGGHASLRRWRLWCRPLYGECSHCKGIHSKEDPHYCTQQRARNKAVTGQATINLYSQVWKPLEDSLPELYWVNLAESYVRQESASLKIYVRKKGMIRDRPRDALTRKLQQRAEMGKKCSIESTTRSCWASCFKKRAWYVPETLRHTYNIIPQSAKNMRKQDKKLDSRAAKNSKKKLVRSDCPKNLV